MTQEQFVHEVSILDKIQGNYEPTKEVMDIRGIVISHSSFLMRAVYCKLKEAGIKMFIYEQFGRKNPKPFFHHIYLPEYQIVIRFFGAKTSPRCGDYYHYVKSFAYPIFVHCKKDTLEWTMEKIGNTINSAIAKKKCGPKSKLIKPEKKKRISQIRYEKIEPIRR